MFITEYEMTEAEAFSFFVESANEEAALLLKEKLVDPIYEKLSHPNIRKKYIEYGDQFIAANADMLAKEYPTKAVSFPRLYVDGVNELFGFTKKQLTAIVKELLNTVNDKANWYHITESVTNVLHTITLVYSDIIQHRQLRDSARQQLGLTMWSRMYQKYWGSTPVLNEALMAYTYSELNQTWDLVKSENMINWIIGLTDGAFQHHRSKLDLDMSPKALANFLNELRNRFNQSTQHLSNRYYENKDKGVAVGDDVTANDDYVETNAYINLRNALILFIKNNDRTYWTEGDLYKVTAKYKDVDSTELFDFATKKIKYSEIATIMDMIFYVFLVKEGNSIKDINSAKYVKRITNFPTAVDRAIKGKPIIEPLMKKYDVSDTIVRAYICLIATYILQRINDVNE